MQLNFHRNYDFPFLNLKHSILIKYQTNFLNFLIGLEDFENKIDKIASGDDKGENSWINDVYNKYGNGTEDDDNEVVPNIEGLEPPMLDETWGLKDGEDKETSTPRVKRNHGPIDDQFKKDFDGGHFKFIRSK